MMNSDFIPVLVIVALVVYPFAVTAVAALVVSRSKRERFPIHAAKLFALAGCIPPIWFVSTYGFGKYPAVTMLGSAVFVFGVAATGGLLGAILDLLISKPLGGATRTTTALTDDVANDENSYISPKSNDE